MRSSLLAPCFALTVAVLAQSPKPASVPPVEDPGLYYSFFYYQQAQIDILRAEKAGNPSNGANLDQQMAAILKIDVKALPAVIGVIQRVIGDYGKIAADREAYLAGPMTSQVGGQTVAVSLLPQYELKKLRATLDGVLSLFQGLPPSSWTGLRDYIAGDFKRTQYGAGKP